MQGDTYQAVWGRFFAAAYDTAFALAERRGLAATRKEVVGQACGRVLELGAGTGLNVNHYPDEGITELILAEPNPHMVSRLRKRVHHLSDRIVVLEATAEDIPSGDSSVDSVVSTLVLCRVERSASDGSAPWSAPWPWASLPTGHDLNSGTVRAEPVWTAFVGGQPVDHSATHSTAGQNPQDLSDGQLSVRRLGQGGVPRFDSDFGGHLSPS